MNNNKLIRIIGIALIGGLILYGLSLIITDKEVSWDPTWSGRDEDPFGTELLKMAVEEFVHPAEFIVANNSPDIILEEYWYNQAAYLFVNNRFDPTLAEWEALTDFAEQGNIVWIAAESISELVESTIDIRMLPPAQNLPTSNNSEDSVTIYFDRPNWPEDPFSIPNHYLGRIIPGKKSLLTHRPIMMSHAGDFAAMYIPQGEGGFCFSAFPKMISNYGLLDPKYEPMVSGLLSMLPDDLETVYWDEWIKIGNQRRRNDREDEEGPGPLSFVWQNPALRMALLLSIGALLLVLVFQTKRIQRIIPPSPPLSNTTLDFTDTVGRLYFQDQQHLQPALKRISAFREFLNETYLLPDHFGSDEFCERLAAKSGKSIKQVTFLIRTIQKTEVATSLNEDQLQSLSEQIDSFIHS